MFRLLTAIFLALSLIAGTGFVSVDELPPGGTFVDDNGNTHEGAIEAIKEAGITSGCSAFGPQYCPLDLVTRAQMATFLVNAFALDPSETNWFDDDNDSIHEDNINAIAQAGITFGCGGRDYCPEDFVRRDQMASFLARAKILPPSITDWFTDDDDNVHEDNINRIADDGVTFGCGDMNYCPIDPVRRDQMASFLARAKGLLEVNVPPASNPKLHLISSSLDGALYATSPDGDDRLFVVEKSGTIALFKGEVETGTKFLDLRSMVSGGLEQGLFGLAFHPDYSSNGLFYVSYTDPGGDSVVAEYAVSGNPDIADSTSRRVILELDQPSKNHNGGMIEFGADGYLYIGFGDGGGTGDPNNHAENPNTWLGSLLRIDIDSDDFPGDANVNYAIPPGNPFIGSTAGADEVWAYGLRNPWRFSFDHTEDLLFVADVGHDSWEEITVVSTSTSQTNYGWDRLEGTHCFEPASGCSSAGTLLPIHEYSHSEGLSVTGGFVYRGAAMPDLHGVYFYGDASRGWVKSFRYLGGDALVHQTWDALEIDRVWGFGKDSDGELYVLGKEFLYKIVP